VNFLIKTFP